jgi:ectoine hydroxylase-related dioxygenase (phytanoyl-CoA dioxygenase family)
VVPGSHVWCRQPDPDLTFDNEIVEVVEVPAGSIAVWHSNLWHAALPRKSGGERVSFVTLYDRPFMQQGDAFPLTTTKEMIERNSARFSVLMGMFGLSLNTAEGPDFAAMPGRSRDMGRWA